MRIGRRVVGMSPSCHFCLHSCRSHCCCSTALHSSPRQPGHSRILRRETTRAGATADVKLVLRLRACGEDWSSTCIHGGRIGAVKDIYIPGLSRLDIVPVAFVGYQS